MPENPNASRDLGLVVVGTGFGCLTHVGASRAAGFTVRTLVGRDASRTSERARRFGIERASTSLADALDDPGVDAVAIATPPHTHGALVREVLAAGKHVLCEKPFARDAAEATELLGAAEATGLVHFLGTEFRWATGQATAARAIRSGVIGTPRLASFLLQIPLLVDAGAEVPDWWSDRDQGGGWLGAHCSHVIDQVRTTLGEFAGLSAGLPHVTERDWSAEDTYLVHFRLRNGVEGVMQSSAADRGPLLLMSRVVGTDGTLWIEGDTVKVAGPAGTTTLDVPVDLVPLASLPPASDLLVTAYDLLHATGIDVGPYTRLYRAFAGAIRGEVAPADPRPGTFADGVANMAVLDAIRRSAAKGTWETVDDG